MITGLAKRMACWYFRQGFENAAFERGMLSLASTTGGTVEDVAAAFKQWVQTTPFPWRSALDYCLQRAIEGKSLPFKVEVNG